VAIAADAKNLEIDTTMRFDGLLVSRAVSVVIAGDGAVGNVNIPRGEIDMRKKILLHEKMEALWMGSGQSQIFV